MPIPTARLAFGPARPADDAQLRRLLRETPMAGAIRLAFEREPSFFGAAAVEGDVHQAIVAREPAGRIVAVASRSLRDAWVNGARRRLGYLSSLRTEPAYRGRPGVLRRGFEALRALHREGDPAFYVTTIIEDNAPARRILEAGLRGFPRYLPREVVVTLALPLHRRRRGPPVPEILREGRAEDLGAIAACLTRRAARHQFAPVVTAERLLGPGLSPGDFTVALRGGEVAGCVALWDQGAFKQSVVHGYAPALARTRPLVNLFAPLLGLPHLPRPGARLRHAFLAHLAVDDDDPALALALVAAAYARARARPLEYLMLGLSERHSLLPVLAGFVRARTYRALLYTVSWEDGAGAVAALDDRAAHLEVATL